VLIPVRIIEFRARNTKIIKAVEIFAGEKDIVLLTGKNRQGKSTVLDAIWMALGGKECIQDVPIRQGEKKAGIYLDLGEFRITRKITGKGESLLVEGRDGQPIPSPQKFLNSCLAENARNPLEFMNLKPADQVKALQTMLDIRLDRPAIERIAGIWTRTIKGDDPMLVIDNVIKGLMEERTGVNREIKRLDGVIESIVIPYQLRDIEPVSIVGLLAGRKALEDQKRANDEARLNAKSLEAGVKSLEEDLSRLDNEIAELETKLCALREKKKTVIQNLSDRQEEYFNAADRADALIDPDFSDIDRRISRCRQA